MIIVGVVCVGMRKENADMGTILNIGSDTRKKFKETMTDYNNAVVCKNVEDGSILAYYEDKLETVQRKIVETDTQINIVNVLLDKKSNKREEYKKMQQALGDMQNKILKVCNKI